MEKIKEEFKKSYKEIEKTLLNDLKNYEMPERLIEYIKKLYEHTILDGKMIRGLSVSSILRDMKNDEIINQEVLFKANVLGNFFFFFFNKIQR
jgi:DNA-binding ferritin-like protein (Dps family)